MKILVVGSGGREHALCWKIKQSPLVTRLYCAPGNAGISSIAECVAIQADDIIALADFAHQENIDLTVVGPEVPLVKGIVDLFEEEGLKIFGPSKAAARLEGSKVYAKNFMKRWDIPTASYATFTDMNKALEYALQQKYPLVIKASGLAAGKGVIIAQQKEDAQRAIKNMMSDKIFKDAGNSIVIEEFLEGEEASILAIADGKDFVLLESSQDHKRIFDDDLGPNTGGMGAYSPAPVITPSIAEEIARVVIRPVIEGMAEEEAPFKGVLYAGIMMTKNGIKVLEFNTRFGDPETQAILPRLKTDLVELMMACVNGQLSQKALEWEKKSCVCVVMAAGGYPGDCAVGKPILGLDGQWKNVVVFHSGTKMEDKRILVSSGRVLGITALGEDIADAIKHAYIAVGAISFDGCQYRKDIGKKALNR